eukprot:1161114-Pelagomonas_calceolata.AAC.4
MYVYTGKDLATKPLRPPKMRRRAGERVKAQHAWRCTRRHARLVAQASPEALLAAAQPTAAHDTTPNACPTDWQITKKNAPVLVA